MNKIIEVETCPSKLKRQTKHLCRTRRWLKEQEIFLTTNMSGSSLMGQFNASPCPNITGLISLCFKLFFLLYLIYQFYNLTIKPSELGSNYWIIENQGPLRQVVTQDFMSEFHLMNDIRLRVGNTQQIFYSGADFDLMNNEEFRINMFVKGIDGDKLTIPWKKCDKQEPDSLLTVVYCPDTLSVQPIKTMVQPFKELISIQILACNSTTEQFSSVKECPSFEQSRSTLQNYNVTLLLTNHEFNITEYAYEWTPYSAVK